MAVNEMKRFTVAMTREDHLSLKIAAAVQQRSVNAVLADLVRRDIAPRYAAVERPEGPRRSSRAAPKT